MRTKLFAGVAFAALVIPAAAMAQSTASQEFNEGSEVVVTGRADRTIGGVDLPNQPKAQVVLDSEIIQRQRPGQTINDVINLVPGVSFQNNDPYGSSGGGFRIRGFDSSRISQTLDGIPLNDSGNYAIYTNQQVDSEIIDNVSVNLGATDVDSPTASAVGGTVNLRTRVPGDELGAMFTASYGEYDYHRVFGMIDTGDITGMGTKAFASASWVSYDNPFNNYGRIKKQQYNARIYQDLAATATSSRSQATTTRLATTSSVRVRCVAIPAARPAPAAATASRPASTKPATTFRCAAPTRRRPAWSIRRTAAAPSMTAATTRRTPATSVVRRASRSPMA